MKKFVLFLILPLLFTSCDLSKLQEVKIEEPKVEVVTYDFDKEKAQSLSTVYSEISADDCLTIYKLFRGTALYLETVVNGPTMTSEVLSDFGKVRDSYGWKPEKFKSLTDAVETYLKDKGYADPSRKFEDHKVDMVSSFNTIAESAKLAWLQKNDTK